MPLPSPFYLEATSAWTGAIVATQVVHAFLCRDPRASVAATGLRGNALLLWGVAFEIALAVAILYTPWGNAVFGTAPLALELWLYLVPCAAALLALEEARKAWVQRLRAPTRRPRGCVLPASRGT